jgi:hypothetical protein
MGGSDDEEEEEEAAAEKLAAAAWDAERCRPTPAIRPLPLPAIVDSESKGFL